MKTEKNKEKTSMSIFKDGITSIDKINIKVHYANQGKKFKSDAEMFEQMKFDLGIPTNAEIEKLKN